MTKFNQNVTMIAGDTVNINCVVRTGPNPTDPVKDISGATIAWVLYNDPAGVVTLTKSTVSGITITSGIGGAFTVALAAGDTESVAPMNYYHEAEVTDVFGNVSTVFTGTVTIKRSRV